MKSGNPLIRPNPLLGDAGLDGRLVLSHARMFEERLHVRGTDDLPSCGQLAGRKLVLDRHLSPRCGHTQGRPRPAGGRAPRKVPRKFRRKLVHPLGCTIKQFNCTTLLNQSFTGNVTAYSFISFRVFQIRLFALSRNCLTASQTISIVLLRRPPDPIFTKARPVRAGAGMPGRRDARARGILVQAGIPQPRRPAQAR